MIFSLSDVMYILISMISLVDYEVCLSIEY